MTLLRFGIIGCSGIAERRFVPALRQVSNAILFGVGSRDSDKAKQWAKQWQAPFSGSYDEILTHPEIDCVYISLPTALHFEWTMKALESGKHVICEKPAVMSLAEAHQALALAHEKNLVFLECFVPRFHRQHQVVDDLISSGKLGEPYYFTGVYTTPMPKDGNVRFQPELGGGIFWDAMGYLVRQYLRVFKTIPKSSVIRHRNHPIYDIPQCSTVLLEGPIGESGQLFAGYGLQYQSTYSVIGTLGSVHVQRAYSIDDNRPSQLLVEIGRHSEMITVEPDHQFLNLIRHFITRIHQDLVHHSDDESVMIAQYQVMDMLI